MVLCLYSSNRHHDCLPQRMFPAITSAFSNAGRQSRLSRSTSPPGPTYTIPSSRDSSTWAAHPGDTSTEKRVSGLNIVLSFLPPLVLVGYHFRCVSKSSGGLPRGSMGLFSTRETVYHVRDVSHAVHEQAVQPCTPKGIVSDDGHGPATVDIILQLLPTDRALPALKSNQVFLS